VSTYLEVLDAQRQLFTAQLNFASSVRDQLAAVVQLYRALGGGWQELAAAPIQPAGAPAPSAPPGGAPPQRGTP
jgi:multidrug efflux system outer membrane protein